MAVPTDAVMHILPQIQDTLADHSRRFDAIIGRFDKVDLRHDIVSERPDELARRVEVLEQAK